MAEFERTITVAKLIEDQGKELNLEVLLGQKYAAKREISKPSVNKERINNGLFRQKKIRPRKGGFLYKSAIMIHGITILIDIP